MKINISHNKWRIIKWLRNTKTVGMEGLIKYMKENGFFTAPCSAGHHLSYEGGLAEHSIQVMEFAIDIAYKYNVPIHPHSIIKCCLLHDIFKMFLYEKIKGNWEYKGLGIMSNNFKRKRHGAWALEIIESFIELTPQEKEIILWHMGPYTDYYDDHKLGDFLKWSNDKKNKNVNAALFLYFCDHFSSMFLED